MLLLAFTAYIGGLVYVWVNFDAIVDAIVERDSKISPEDAKYAVKFILIAIGIGGFSKQSKSITVCACDHYHVIM